MVRTRQVYHAVLVHRCGRKRIDHRIHVVDQHRFAVRTYARIIVGHNDVDRIAVLRGRRRIVIQVLVRQRKRLAASGAGTEGIRLGVVRREWIAPVYVERECIQRSWIGNRTSQRSSAVLVDRHHRIQRYCGSHVVHLHRDQVAS